jgi:hypothetical protein
MTMSYRAFTFSWSSPGSTGQVLVSKMRLLCCGANSSSAWAVPTEAAPNLLRSSSSSRAAGEPDETNRSLPGLIASENRQYPDT